VGRGLRAGQGWRAACYSHAVWAGGLPVEARYSPPEVSVSPILVRPVREQLEHDRVIRLLQAKYKRKYDVGINPGDQQLTPAGIGGFFTAGNVLARCAQPSLINKPFFRRNIMWTKPAATEMRFGFEVTMYVMNK
jgi:coenzyme PQQ precursor peptide PqqA